MFALALSSAVCVARTGRAQPPGIKGTIVSASLGSDSLSVGEPFTVKIRVRASKIATIRFPPVPDSADAIEAIDPRYIEDASDNAVLDRTAVYRLVAWDVGAHQPHFANVVVSASGVDQSFPVAVGRVVVTSVLATDSASRVPKAARQPLPVPSGIWRYVLILSLTATAAVWYLLRRFRGRAARVPAGPEAFDAANLEFKALDALGLIEAGEPGRHVIAHVDVMRSYVARRFPAAMTSLTGAELVTTLETSALPQIAGRIGQLLQIDSGVRYARVEVGADDAAALAREARLIVKDVQREHEASVRALDRAPSRQRKGKTR